MSTYLGTTINESPTIILEAGAAITKAQGKAVIISGGRVIAATAGVNAIGLIPLSEEAEIASGDSVTVQVKDIGAWVAGEAIAVGDELTSDANGFAVKAVAGNYITAIALTTAAKSGTIIRAQIIKGGYVPTPATPKE